MLCHLKNMQLTRRKDFAEKNVFRKPADIFLEDPKEIAARGYCDKREELPNQSLNQNSLLQKKETLQ